MKPYILFSLVLIFAFSCKRKGEPFPRICTETGVTVNTTTTIGIHDTLGLINCSDKSTKQRWVMPDGGTSTNDKVYFIPPTTGTYTVTLYVGNDNFVNEYTAVRTVVVTP